MIIQKGKLIGLGGAGLLLAATGSMLWTRAADRKQTQRLWHHLATLRDGTTERFSEAMVADLPEPARRYFLHAIAPGTPLAQAVVLEMEGAIRIQPDGPWLPMQARQVLAPPHGFVWEAAVRQGVMRLSGADSYGADEGHMRFRLWGLVPVVQGGGPDVTRSARGRLAIEAVMHPAALLPQRGVVWDAVDAHTARATLTIDGEAFPLTLTIKPDGRLHSARIDRWGNQTADGHYASLPFGVTVLEENTFEGYSIPARMRVGWWFGTERYTDFFDATLTHATFH